MCKHFYIAAALSKCVSVDKAVCPALVQLSLCALDKQSGCADCVHLPQTLGHLEKAVVLELTLKHVKALTCLLEQQQQKILALQSGMQIGELQTCNVHNRCKVAAAHNANWSNEFITAG